MIIKIVILAILLCVFFDKMIKKYFNNTSVKLLGFTKFFIQICNISLWIILLSLILSLFYHKRFLFILILSLSLLLSILCIFIVFDRYFGMKFNIGHYILFFNIYIITIVTLLCIIFSLYLYYTTKNMKTHDGEEGLLGDVGDRGHESKDGTDSEICYQHLVLEVDNTFNNWKERNDYSVTKDNDQIKNLYIKDKLKMICKSKEFKLEVINNGVINTIKKIKNNAILWTMHILKYKRGKYFLEDYLSNDNSWDDELLYKGYPYNEVDNPFKKIKNDKIWNWGFCENK